MDWILADWLVCTRCRVGVGRSFAPECPNCGGETAERWDSEAEREHHRAVNVLFLLSLLGLFLGAPLLLGAVFGGFGGWAVAVGRLLVFGGWAVAVGALFYKRRTGLAVVGIVFVWLPFVAVLMVDGSEDHWYAEQAKARY